MTKGYGLCYEACGTVKSKKCPVCYSKMEVERNYCGPTSWAGAMAHCKTTCDRFFCPHTESEWHRSAVEIIQQAEGTKSPSLKKLLLGDVKDIVAKGLGVL